MECLSFIRVAVFILSILPSGAVVGQRKTPNCQGCCSTPAGSPGVPGVPGVPGTPGPYGRPGAKGETGSQGSVGSVGTQGRKGDGGPQGHVGLQGLVGPTGPKGEPGEKRSDYANLILESNWKQCAWAKSDGKDIGLIQDCPFQKKYDNTSLHVFYGGNLRIYGCNSCCKRWYFTFDGAECKNPMAIDGVYYLSTSSGKNLHRHRHIEGYCNRIPKGHIRVGFWIGNCASYGAADGYSGWNSVSRIVVEEVPPPQV